MKRLLALGLVSFACSQEPAQQKMPPPPPGTQAAATKQPVGAASQPATAATAAAPAPAGDATEEANALFRARCATCHGAAGLGDGPVAAALNPKPRSFADADWQKSVTDEHIEKIIRDGGPAVGKSPIMPANPDLKDKPAVITALRDVVRSLAKK